MDFRLRITRVDELNDNSSGNFRIAVVDFSRSKSYPLNFVCMLPLNAGKTSKVGNVFEHVFGNASLEQATVLLKESLNREDDGDVKTEIKRRLKLLDPNRAKRVICGSCGKPFNALRLRKFRRNLCETCLIRRYGIRQTVPA